MPSLAVFCKTDELSWYNSQPRGKSSEFRLVVIVNNKVYQNTDEEDSIEGNHLRRKKRRSSLKPWDKYSKQKLYETVLNLTKEINNLVARRYGKVSKHPGQPSLQDYTSRQMPVRKFSHEDLRVSFSGLPCQDQGSVSLEQLLNPAFERVSSQGNGHRL